MSRKRRQPGRGILGLLMLLMQRHSLMQMLFFLC